MSSKTTEFKHVSYLWDEAKAAELAGDEVALSYTAPTFWVPICALPTMVAVTPHAS